MRHLLLFSLLASFLYSCTSNHEAERKNGAYESLQFLADQRAYPHDDLSAATYFQEIAHFHKGNESLTRENDPEPWESLGPHNIAGRMLALAINPENRNTLWAGSASGGLWRSYNRGLGVSWEQVPLGHPVLGVSSAAFHPQDSMIMYIGTGEVYNSLQSGNGAAFRSTRGTYGMGVLKSVDGGITWTKSLDWSYELERGVHAVKVSESNPEMIYAGTTEGLYISSDAGETWEHKLAVAMANDFLIHPSDPDKIMVGCGNLNSQGKGIYTTSNGGDTWSAQLPVDFDGKIQFAADPSGEEKAYASVGNGFSFANGATWVLKTVDFGENWELKNTTDYSKWQGWFAHDIAVNPDNPSRLTMIGIEIYGSNNGASSVDQLTVGGVAFGTPGIGIPDGPPNFTHSDHHDVIYDPVNGDRVYVANDGGVYASENGGTTWESRNGGLQTTQFYNGFSVFSSDTETLAMGGLQDNSTIEYTGTKAWNRVVGGDGSWSAIHTTDSDIRYGSAQNLFVARTLDGNSYASLFIPGDEFPTAFIAPYVLAPSAPNTIYAGRDRVVKTTNGGETWAIQEDLGSDFLLSMDVSPTNADFVYVGTAPNNDRARVHMTRNGGTSYTDITTGLPNAYINDVHVHPTDPEVAYVALGGFGGKHVYVTEDGGSSWDDITANLPAIPTSAILVDPADDNIIYVGNDYGVFVSEDSGANWSHFSDGLGDAVLVMDLKLNTETRKIFVATHGSGAFQRDMLPSSSVSVTDFGAQHSAKLLANPVQERLEVVGLASASDYKIMDAGGRLVQQGRVNSEGIIRLQGISAGNYFLNINGLSTVIKFSKL